MDGIILPPTDDRILRKAVNTLYELSADEKVRAEYEIIRDYSAVNNGA